MNEKEQPTTIGEDAVTEDPVFEVNGTEMFLSEAMRIGHAANYRCKEYIEECLGVKIVGFNYNPYSNFLDIYPDEDVTDIQITKDMNYALQRIGCDHYWINYSDGGRSFDSWEKQMFYPINMWKTYSSDHAWKEQTLIRIKGLKKEMENIIELVRERL